MEGSNLYRASLALGHMLKRPTDVGRWVDDNFGRRRSALDRALPWMSWRAIEFLEEYVQPGMRVFEWGGGGSTAFFVNRGCSVVTVESSRAWKCAIEGRLAEAIRQGALEIRLVEAETGDADAVAKYISSIRIGGPWDIVVVDGLEEIYISRTQCIRELKPFLNPGGMVLLDDAYRTNYSEVPRILSNWERKVFRSLGSARMGVTQTDAYFAP